MSGEPKPPFVRFETRSVEDRDASIEAGHYVGVDTVYAIVTPVGTRDTIEKPVEDWLANIEEGVKQERIPQSWLSAYRGAYKDYQESRETPEFGTPIKDWPVATPSQIRTMLDINVRTVEQLADANEETVGRIGMGGRALKEKAKNWLETSGDQGKVAERMNALETENGELKTRNEDLAKRLEALEAKLAEEDA